MEPTVQKHYARLQDVRKQVVDLLSDLNAEEIHFQPYPDFNSVGVLARHLAGAERYWIGEVLGGFPAGRNRAAEFIPADLGRAPLLDLLVTTRQLTAQVLTTLSDASLDEISPCLSGSGREIHVSREWMITHHIEHEYQHYGQMLLLVKLARQAG